MVDIEYKPTKKIVAHEIIKKPLDEFINLKARPQNANVIQSPARWADGIVSNHQYDRDGTTAPGCKLASRTDSTLDT